MISPLNPETIGLPPAEVTVGMRLALAIPREITAVRQEADGWWLDLAGTDPAGPCPEDSTVYVLPAERETT